MRNKSKNPIVVLRNKAWALMSEWIRRRWSDKDGNVVCITCGKKIHWKKAHASHYKHGRLDFDEININPSCSKCNVFLHGNLGNYTIFLVEKYGLDVVNDLCRRANVVHKYSRQELEDIIKDLKEKIDGLNREDK